MTAHHFGTGVNAAQFVELAAVEVTADDSSVIRVSGRPASGLELLVRDPDTLDPLDPITVDGNGYWSYTVDDVPGIQVSGDGGSSWSGILWSQETQDAAMQSASDLVSVTDRVAAAEGDITALDTRVTAVEAGGGGGGGGPIASTSITDSTPLGRSLITADTAATVRSLAGAGTSNLVVGTTAGTAKDGAYQPTVGQISDAGTMGRTLARSDTAVTAKTALGLERVNNTADIDKPVSSATAAALATKGKAPVWFATTAAATTAATTGQLQPGDEIRVLAP